MALLTIIRTPGGSKMKLSEQRDEIIYIITSQMKKNTFKNPKRLQKFIDKTIKKNLNSSNMLAVGYILDHLEKEIVYILWIRTYKNNQFQIAIKKKWLTEEEKDALRTMYFERGIAVEDINEIILFMKDNDYNLLKALTYMYWPEEYN